MSDLGTFEQISRPQGDNFPANDNKNKPLIVVVRAFRENMRTKHHPAGDGTGVVVDVVDLLADAVYIDALWMSGALVDNLRPHAGSGTPLPVKINTMTGASGNPYLVLDPLVDQARALAEGWYAKNATRIADERAKREAEAKPLGTVAQSAPAQASETPASAPAAQEPAAAPAAAPSASMNEDAVAAALARLNG